MSARHWLLSSLILIILFVAITYAAFASNEISQHDPRSTVTNTPTASFTPLPPTATLWPTDTNSPLPSITPSLTPIPTEDPIDVCQVIGMLEICAEDMYEQSPGIFLGTQQITIVRNGASVLSGHLKIIDGSIMLTPSSGAIIISSGIGPFSVIFDPVVGADITINSGFTPLIFENAQTSIGMLPFPNPISFVGDLGGVEFDGTVAPQLVYDVNIGLVFTGGTLRLVSPRPKTLTLNTYKIYHNGLIEGSVQPFAILAEAGGFTIPLNVTSALFSSEGLMASGTIDFLRLFPSLPLLDFGGVRFTSHTVTTPVSITGGVEFNSLIEPLQIGAIRVRLGRVGLASGNVRALGEELYLEALDVQIAVRSEIFFPGNTQVPSANDLGIKVKSIRIFPDDIEISGPGLTGRFQIPDFYIGRFRVCNARFSVEVRDTPGEITGFALVGGGSLRLPGLSTGLDCGEGSGKTAELDMQISIVVEEDFSGVNFDKAVVTLKGLNYPLGTTPVYLTRLQGELKQTNVQTRDDWMFNANATLEVSVGKFRKFVKAAILKGDPALTVFVAESDGQSWGEISGSLRLFEQFPLAEASLNMNKPNVSQNGIRGTVKLEAFILNGLVNLFISHNEPYFDLFGRVALEIKFADLPAFIRVWLQDESSYKLSSVAVRAAEIDGEWGIVSGLTIRDSKYYAMVKFDGEIDFGIGWPNALVQTRNIDTRDGDIRETLSYVIPPGAPNVIFALDKRACPKLRLTLIAPDLEILTPKSLPAGAMYRNFGGAQAYAINAPQSGNWQVVVTRGATTLDCTVDVRIKDVEPVFSDFSVVSSDNFNVNWIATDPENTATVSLYYDLDGLDYNGVLFADNLPLSGNMIWDGQAAPTGNVYVYARIDDGRNMPTFSPYSQLLWVVNTTAPSAPSGVQAHADETTVRLQWIESTSPDIAYYKAEVTYSNAPDFVQSYQVGSSPLFVSRPDDIQTVTATLYAVDTTGNISAPSAAITILPSQLNDLTPPMAPVNVQVSVIENNVTVTWPFVLDAMAYKVYYDFGSSSTFDATGAVEGNSPIIVGNVNQFTLSGLSIPSTIRIAISALDANGNEGLPSDLVIADLTGSTPAVELLANGGFEIPGQGSKAPLKWLSNNAKKIKRICNVSVAPIHSGDCVLQIAHAGGLQLNTMQKINLKTTQPGSKLWITGWFGGLNLNAVPNVVLKVKYADLTAVKFTIPLQHGTFSFTSFEDVLTIEKPAKSLKVSVNYAGNTGKFFADNFSVRVITGDRENTRGNMALPPPTVPEGFRSP